MPNCSAPGCKSNYTPGDRVPIFKMPDGPPDLRLAWFRALHREDIADLKVVYVCAKHFETEDIDYVHVVPRGDGSFHEVPRARPKLKPGAVPSLLPGCPSYYSSTGAKRSRFSFDSKDEDLLNQALSLSLKSEKEDTEKYLVNSLQDVKDKLNLLSLPNNWLFWFPSHNCFRFILPKMVKLNISVDIYLEINIYLSANIYLYGKIFPHSINTISDIRQIETILSEVNLEYSSTSENKHTFNIPRAKEHIEQTISDLIDNDVSESDCSELSRLQFIICQLENAFVHKKKRRYNIITQIMAIQAHLISPACYNFLQRLDCISLPHVHTLEKLYSSFGLENDFCTYLSQVTSSFSPEERNVIVQMDEIHVKSDISYKGGKIFGPNLTPENPTKTVFAIMVSSLHKKWSCISRLLPCASVNAEYLFPIIKSCILDIESCGLRVQIISTDNYPLNVSIFKLFSPARKLETRVPHPSDNQRILFLTFDFVHILKSIRNNWLNQKNADKTFHFPNLDNFELDHCKYPLQLCSATFADVRILYNSERESLAKLAPHLSIKACFPSSIERQNVKLVLKVVNELTIAALKIQDEFRCQENRNNTAYFVDILLILWKMFNVNTPLKGIRLKDNNSKPFTFNDERFSYLARVVFWLEAWQALPEKMGKLSKQTFTSFRHACIVLPQITNHLTQSCGFEYLLTSFLQTDPLEHHFGLYRMMSGSNYHISYLQILETERRLKLSNILKIFSGQQEAGAQSIQTFVESFSFPSAPSSDEFYLEPFLDEIDDLSFIECNSQILQSLSFIAGYSVHQYLKKPHLQPCHVCLHLLTFDKEFLFEEISHPHFKLLQLTDRGSLKYPSEIVLNAIVILWKIFVAIENNNNLLTLLVQGASRKLLVQLTIIFLEDTNDHVIWKSSCICCSVHNWTILRTLMYTSANCLLANKIKNYNSLVSSKGIEKRKLKKFS